MSAVFSYPSLDREFDDSPPSPQLPPSRCPSPPFRCPSPRPAVPIPTPLTNFPDWTTLENYVPPDIDSSELEPSSSVSSYPALDYELRDPPPSPQLPPSRCPSPPFRCPSPRPAVPIPTPFTKFDDSTTLENFILPIAGSSELESSARGTNAFGFASPKLNEDLVSPLAGPSTECTHESWMDDNGSPEIQRDPEQSVEDGSVVMKVRLTLSMPYHLLAMNSPAESGGSIEVPDVDIPFALPAEAWANQDLASMLACIYSSYHLKPGPEQNDSSGMNLDSQFY